MNGGNKSGIYLWGDVDYTWGDVLATWGGIALSLVNQNKTTLGTLTLENEVTFLMESGVDFDLEGGTLGILTVNTAKS